MSAARILAPDPQPELALDGEHGLPRWAAALARQIGRCHVA